MTDPQNPENKPANPGGAPADDGPKYMTPEMFNAAISSWGSRMTKNLEKNLEKIIADRLASKPAVDADPSSDATARGATPSSGTPSGGSSPGVSPDILQLREENAKIKRHMAEEAKARKEERERSLRNEERLKLTELLKSDHVPEARIRGLLAMFDVDKRIQRDDEGNILFRHDDINDPVPLVDGYKKWRDTDEGKAYLPARGAAGVGIQRGNQRPGGRPVDPKEAARREAAVRLVNSIRNG